jgi:hypothetical protein
MLEVEQLEDRCLLNGGILNNTIPLQSPIAIAEAKGQAILRADSDYQRWYVTMFVKNSTINDPAIAGDLRAMERDILGVEQLLARSQHELEMARLNAISANNSEFLVNIELFSARYHARLAEANRFIGLAQSELYSGVERFGSEAQTALDNYAP